MRETRNSATSGGNWTTCPHLPSQEKECTHADGNDQSTADLTGPLWWSLRLRSGRPSSRSAAYLQSFEKVQMDSIVRGFDAGVGRDASCRTISADGPCRNEVISSARLRLNRP
ncbi:hypothetical protein, variant [Verruconis gallopava]|uniref:Uncharacterized protein n=1 Tax=Verruconis gallopava TaxID=253628 RepID=A0A0D2A6V0_9PEZI|nr:uncharacterized protein PV09_06461 [Verruconis gallopava]XP_016212184.1 hypothetical protein, variant [Verruconis gallopava]KIW02314.1 hypothetical protein PV09_06461 [Verruconis gallopava]KIW02315.1 hypothetical protein, variant [Verruconis gallopava]